MQESHGGLAHAYRKLGKALQTVGDSHVGQGTAEATTLLDPLQYHTSSAFIAKETLTNRHILQRELIQAQQATRARLAAADRLKSGTSTVRSDKVDEAITLLDEAREHETQLTGKTRRVTQHLLAEQERWFERTSVEMRDAVREYVGRQIDAERRTLAMLEAVRPDIRGIDGSGGLSRLGREKHPLPPAARARAGAGNLNSSVLGGTVAGAGQNAAAAAAVAAAVPRRSVLASSQGARGDAWSGIPRRSAGAGIYGTNRDGHDINNHNTNEDDSDDDDDDDDDDEEEEEGSDNADGTTTTRIDANNTNNSSNDNDDNNENPLPPNTDTDTKKTPPSTTTPTTPDSKPKKKKKKEGGAKKAKTKKQQSKGADGLSGSGVMGGSVGLGMGMGMGIGGDAAGGDEEDDDDRIDARNAASRLAQTTF